MERTVRVMVPDGKDVIPYPRPGTDAIVSWVEDGPDPGGTNLPLDTSCPALDATLGDGDVTGWGPSGLELFFNRSTLPKKVHWSVPWSDLMMTMFILFVVMYIYHAQEKEYLSPDGLGKEKGIHYTTPPPANSEEAGYDHQHTLPKLFDLSTTTLKARNLKNFASVDLVADRAVRLIVTGDLLFAVGDTALKPEAKEKLKQLAPIIKETPYKVNIVGHTDNLPLHSNYLTNWELSVIRACVVARFFIEEMGVPEHKFFLSGHAYFQPLRPHTTEENRAVNRRVEIILTRERPYGLPFSGTPLFSEEMYNQNQARRSTGSSLTEAANPAD